MYVNLTKILRFPIVLIGLIIIGFSVFKFITSITINQQIASTLLAIFGLQFMWFFLWLFRGKK